MTREQLYRHIQGLSTSVKVRLLSRLGHNLTIASREACTASDPAMALEKLRALNELLHTVTGRLMSLCGDTPDEFSDDEFLDVLFDKAQRDGCEFDLLQALHWSWPAAA